MIIIPILAITPLYMNVFDFPP